MHRIQSSECPVLAVLHKNVASSGGGDAWGGGARAARVTWAGAPSQRPAPRRPTRPSARDERNAF